MQYQLGALATCAAIFVYVVLRSHRKRFAIKDVPGPVNPSWIFGTSPDGQPGPFHPLLWVDGTDYETFKDTNGISRPKKLEKQRRDSLRISGTLFV